MALRRRKPLERRKPLVARKGLERRTELPRVSVKRAALADGKPARKRPADTGPDRNTRDLVKERENWQCARCGKYLFYALPEEQSIHHRRNRGAGGSSDAAINRPSNLVLICGSATTECHGEITRNENREQAIADGWIVSTNSKTEDPATVPVDHFEYGLVYLRDDGSVTPARRAAA